MLTLPSSRVCFLVWIVDLWRMSVTIQVKQVIYKNSMRIGSAILWDKCKVKKKIIIITKPLRHNETGSNRMWFRTHALLLGPCFGALMSGRHHQKIQGCQIDQQIKSWSKDQLQDSIANKGMAWPNYRRFSFPFVFPRAFLRVSKVVFAKAICFPSWFSAHTYRHIPISLWLKADLHCTCPHACVLREVVIRSVCGAWAKAIRDRRLNISRRVTILPLSPTPTPKLHVCLFIGEKYNGNDPPPIKLRKGEKPSTRIFFKIVRQKQQNWNSQRTRWL